MNRRLASLSFLLLICAYLYTQAAGLRSASEIKLAMKKLTVLGSVLYVGAHPDDENTALLATLAQGRCYRTGYLSITRGEGGQNLLGPEQGEALGLIRTQELLAARRIDGAEQYFTSAIDFGYSKSPEETLKFWGKEKILSDVVWVIRKFRPDVIITRFTPLLGGHGNHTASAILAIEAFHAAADPNRFSWQLKYFPVWQAKRIVFNVFRFTQSEQVQNSSRLLNIDIGSYSPLLGKSFTEIAAEARSMHKSQGMGSALNRGEFLNYFEHIDGDSAKKDIFDGINTGWSRIQNADTIGRILNEVYRTFDDLNPTRSIPLLFRALNKLNNMPEETWIQIKKEEIKNIILSCAGIWIDATTNENYFVAGDKINLLANVINRSPYPLTLKRLSLPFGGKDSILNSKLVTDKPLRINLSVKLPDEINCSQPYWLIEKADIGSYNITDKTLVGEPENIPPVILTFRLSSPDGEIEITKPVMQKVVDPIEGELLRPLVIAPPVAINMQEPVVLFPSRMNRDIQITLSSEKPGINGTVKLKLPEGWNATPATTDFNFQKKGEEKISIFEVSPINGAKSGSFTAEVRTGKNIINRGIQVIQYNHIPPQVIFPEAEGKILRTDVKKTGSTIGYIMGAGDDMPAAISQMGYSVRLITDEELAQNNLDKYDVIVAGVRAYNTRPKLHIFKQRLMDYVKHGGTYVVQYITTQRNEAADIGPYPISISHDRVSEEDAKINFINRNHKLLTTPNVISEKDFNNWIQERGLYFADRWDARYDSIISCHDKGEPDKAGGLLAAHYGNGYFVFCAYSFFRQLPAGVEGAYRIFANILSLQSGRSKNSSVKPIK